MAEQHTPKLSPAQRKVLENLAAGKDPGDHLRTMSDHGGFRGTMASLRRRAWVDVNGITDAGRAALQTTGGGKP